MELRPATEADTEAIRRVALRAWRATYDDLLDEETIEETVDDWYADETLASAFDSPGTAFVVATEDDDVVGFCHGVCQDDEGYVLRLYVDPDHQGRGIGTALHERLRDDLLDFNMRRMKAIVLAGNEAGNAFYEGLDFEKTDEGEVELGGERYAENVYTLSFTDEEV
ncbi:N-acetyltransferase [halophilic archaeon]|nr:N-acetyltransferase [halophilic archaeon]